MVLGLVPWLAPYYLLLPVGKTRKIYTDFIRERANERLKKGSQRKDLFHHLVSPLITTPIKNLQLRRRWQIDEDAIELIPPTQQEIESDGMLAIVAGSNTTSTTLSHLFLYLLQNPPCYDTLRKEVDVLGNDLTSTAQHTRMPYLNAVM